MVTEKKDEKNIGGNFSQMVKEFGEAISQVFNDPELKQKAQELSQSASESAQTFGSRFKDEEVKKKFREAGKAAKKFGESVSETFKDDTGSDNSSNKENKEQGEKKVFNPEEGRGSRLTGYSVSIAWGIVFLVFFNFFHQYVAYYHYNEALQTWTRFPVLTDDFRLWLPIFSIAVAISIVGNIVMIIIDNYYVRQITNLVMNIFGIAAVSALLRRFPFDFSNLPVENIGNILYPVITVILVLIIIGLSIATVVSLVKLVVFAIKKGI